jgi:hypothetical protein
MSTVAIADQASGCGAAPIRRNERNGMSTAAGERCQVDAARGDDAADAP